MSEQISRCSLNNQLSCKDSFIIIHSKVLLKEAEYDSQIFYTKFPKVIRKLIRSKSQPVKINLASSLYISVEMSYILQKLINARTKVWVLV